MFKHLHYLLQAVIQMIGVLYAFLWTSSVEGPNTVVISTVAVGFISLVIGELGCHPTLHFFSTLIYLTYHIFLFI